MHRKRNWKWHVPFLAFLIIASVIIVRQNMNAPFQNDRGFVFGTVYDIKYQCHENLKKGVEAELKKVDNALSPFNKASVITAVNNGDTVVPRTQEGDMFMEVFRRSVSISEATDGAFDITVAPLVNLWGFGFSKDSEPTRQKVDSLLPYVGYRNVKEWETGSRRGIHKASREVLLDCSSIAKGYGCDVVARYLKGKGVENYMVEIGGEIIVAGHNSRGEKWNVGIVEPEDDSLAVKSQVQQVLRLTGKAMATSGNYRNFYVRNGRKFAHTIDPATGYPVQHTLLSTTVLANDCATADAYATAFMVMGMDKAIQLLEKHGELAAYFIYAKPDGTMGVWYSSGIRNLIGQ
ncbi:MAG: FAD:protein FMN transferase [Prevotella sp.]